MKNIFYYILFYILLSFIFINNVYAECSYQERKDLLNAAKKVNLSFDVVETEEDFVSINPNTEEEEVVKRKVYSFDLNVVNVSENIFVKIYNLYDDEQIIVDNESLVDGVYTHNIKNTSDIIKYYVEFYSENNNCFAEKIHSTTIKKPKENQLHYFSICSNEKVSASNYCKQFIDKEFTKSVYELASDLNKFVEESDKLENENKNNNSNSLLNFIKDYWYILVVVVIVSCIIGITIYIRKKRSRL